MILLPVELAGLKMPIQLIVDAFEHEGVSYIGINRDIFEECKPELAVQVGEIESGLMPRCSHVRCSIFSIHSRWRVGAMSGLCRFLRILPQPVFVVEVPWTIDHWLHSPFKRLIVLYRIKRLQEGWTVLYDLGELFQHGGTVRCRGGVVAGRLRLRRGVHTLWQIVGTLKGMLACTRVSIGFSSKNPIFFPCLK